VRYLFTLNILSDLAYCFFRDFVLYILFSGKALVKEHITPYALAKKADIRQQVVKRILNGTPNAEFNTISKMGESMNLHLCRQKK
jgi:DNA-binding phage protein